MENILYTIMRMSEFYYHWDSRTPKHRGSLVLLAKAVSKILRTTRQLMIEITHKCLTLSFTNYLGADDYFKLIEMFDAYML